MTTLERKPQVGDVVERGIRDCVECGRPHDCIVGEVNKDSRYEGWARRVSWGDPTDGHSYRPESWEKFAHRVMAERDEALGVREGMVSAVQKVIEQRREITRLTEALKEIAAGRATRPTGAKATVHHDGERHEAVYVEVVSPQAIARAALAAGER